MAAMQYDVYTCEAARSYRGEKNDLTNPTVLWNVLAIRNDRGLQARRPRSREIQSAGLERRCIVAVDIVASGEPVTVATVHMEWMDDPQGELDHQQRQITDWMAEAPNHQNQILFGDFNSEVGALPRLSRMYKEDNTDEVTG